jgi:dethiobiotin synthetase
MGHGLFVTGTDTGIGKTVIARALLHGYAEMGLSTAAMKPVASGCERTAEGLRNEDALALMQTATTHLRYEDVNPYAFEPPIAPHIAAREAGVEIDFDRIAAHYRRIATFPDLTVVEGVGGWLVPLSGWDTVGDLAAQLELDVVLVVGLRLGCINHALLSAEAIHGRGCNLVGWIANQVDPAMERVQENIDTLVAQIAAPLLGAVPYMERPDAEQVLGSIELPQVA